MRIMSGKYGGRRIHPPANMPHTRPTTDIAKEGLFNILQNRVAIEGASTLDLFGGTGCISYELASRGAEQLTIVEKDKTMLDRLDLLRQLEPAQLGGGRLVLDALEPLADLRQLGRRGCRPHRTGACAAVDHDVAHPFGNALVFRVVSNDAKAFFREFTEINTSFGKEFFEGAREVKGE